MGAKSFFRTAIRCTRCGTLNDGKKIDLSSPIGGEPDWDFLEPGEAVDAGVDDLEGPLLLLHRPDGDRVFVLEFFVCESCRAYSPALIELRIRTPYVLEFVGATAIPALTRDVSLPCTQCCTLNDAQDIDLSSAIGADPDWPSVKPGEAIDVGPDDLEGSLVLLHRPEGDRIFVIEFFVCQACRLYSPALIELRVRTPHVLQFVAATAIPALTREVLDNAHYMTTKIVEWTPQPGEDEGRINQLKKTAMAIG